VVLGCLLVLGAVLTTSAAAPPGTPRSGKARGPGADAPGHLLDRLQADLAGVRAQRQSQVLEEEDRRLLDLVSTVPFAALPYTVPTGEVPSLVLTPTGREYGLGDLEALGAAVRSPDGTVDLVEHVLVAPGASLRIAAPGTTLRLRARGSQFVSLVAWKSTLVLAGAAGAPLRITSWDPAAGTPDPSPLDGRPYIRTAGGSMVLDHVHASDLGFWSGRTGGVAWTGGPRTSGSGSISDSEFTRGRYGVFASGTRDLAVTGSAFEDNEVDGLALHRGAVRTVVTDGRSAGNGRYGVSADLGSENLQLRGVDVSRNAVAGLSFSGAPFAAGPSASGAPTRGYGGLTVVGGRAVGNGVAGVRVVQGRDVSISGLTVAGGQDGIVLVGTGFPTRVQRTAVRDTRRFGISVRDGTAELEGNRLEGGAVGIRVIDATATVRGNEVRAAGHYGLSVSGRSDGSAVVANTLAGRGPAAVDTFRLTGEVREHGNDVTGWTEDEDDWLYWSRFVPRHPMVVLWIVVLLVPLAARWRARRRRPPLGTPPYRDDLRRMRPLVQRLDGTTARSAVGGNR
jgi:hypothetical protein